MAIKRPSVFSGGKYFLLSMEKGPQQKWNHFTFWPWGVGKIKESRRGLKQRGSFLGGHGGECLKSKERLHELI